MRLLLLLALASCVPDLAAARKNLRSAVDDTQDDLNACYAKRLSRDADAKGEMALTLHVGTNGAVDEVQVASSEVKDKKLDKCVTETLEQVVVKPAPDAEFSIDYTLQLGGEKKAKKGGGDDDEDDKPKKKKPKPKKDKDEGTESDDN